MVLTAERVPQNRMCQSMQPMLSTRQHVNTGQYADRCRFVHTVLDYKDGRCFNYSGKGHSRRECSAGKRSESRDPRGETEDTKVAKATKVRQRSRERPGSTGRGNSDGQETPEPIKKTDPTKESTVTITPLPMRLPRWLVK